MQFSEIISIIFNISYLETLINNPLVTTVVGGIIVAIILGTWSFFTKKGKDFWRFIWRKISRIKPRSPRSTIRIVCNPKRLWWHVGTSNGKPAMQLSAHLHITNITNQPVFILRAYLKKPSVEGIIFVKHPNSNYFGGYSILPGQTTEGSADFWIYPAVKKKGEPFKAKIVLVDQYGNHHKTGELNFASDFRPGKKKRNLTPERIYKINDPIEKTVVSVLQDELHRYQKYGRREGGLGSVTTNSTEEKVQSDNAKTLVDYYSQESEQDKKKQIVDNLLSRLSEDKGYSDVAYLILLVLFRIGHLKAALEKAKCELQDSEPYGFSDFLRLLEKFLKLEPERFSDDMLDQVESFIDGLKEHTFRIPERLAAIRAQLIKRKK